MKKFSIIALALLFIACEKQDTKPVIEQQQTEKPIYYSAQLTGHWDKFKCDGSIIERNDTLFYFTAYNGYINVNKATLLVTVEYKNGYVQSISMGGLPQRINYPSVKYENNLTASIKYLGQSIQLSESHKTLITSEYVLIDNEKINLINTHKPIFNYSEYIPH